MSDFNINIGNVNNEEIIEMVLPPFSRFSPEAEEAVDLPKHIMPTKNNVDELIRRIKKLETELEFASAEGGRWMQRTEAAREETKREQYKLGQAMNVVHALLEDIADDYGDDVLGYDKVEVLQEEYGMPSFVEEMEFSFTIKGTVTVQVPRGQSAESAADEIASEFESEVDGLSLSFDDACISVSDVDVEEA